jgi:hypothetical protein
MSVLRWRRLYQIVLALICAAHPAVLCAEPLRIVYTAVSLMYGPLWVTQDTGVFRKNNLGNGASLYRRRQSLDSGPGFGRRANRFYRRG